MENLNQNQTSPGNSSSVQLPEKKEPTPISPSFYRKPLIEDNDDTSIQAPEQELPQSNFTKEDMILSS